MATTSSTSSHDTSTPNITNTKIKSILHISRSLERALDEAADSGELLLNGRKLRDIPSYAYSNDKCDLSDTIIADLSRNHFIEFPRILCTFFSLERLNLHHNAIKSIPEQIVQIHMLKILDLSRNQLAYIPPALCKLPNLEILIVNNNKLVSLPEEIGQLEKLIELDVSCNDITQLPYQLGILTCLRVLNICRNMIAELPTELCNLKLTHFDCSFNRVVRLPLNLREMVSLIELNIEHNPLESPPPSVCTLGLLHIMRFLLVEAMKEEKRRGLLTEHEINAKYRNSFSYQGSRHIQCGTQMKKTVVPSDSGYLTNEGSEKTTGDDDSVLSMPNEHSLHSESSLALTLADEFSKELARQKADYDKKKCQAYQLKLRLLQQLGETENQRAKTREMARRTHDEKLAKMEKQREDARRKMENSKNIQLFNFSSKERPVPSSTLTRQLSNIGSVSSSISGTIIDDGVDDYISYQRSLSIDSATVDNFPARTNRAVSVEPKTLGPNHDLKVNNGYNHGHAYQQRSLTNGSTNQYEITSRPLIKSETIDATMKSSPNVSMINFDRSNDAAYDHFEESRLMKLKYSDAQGMNLHRNGLDLQSMKKAQPFSLDEVTFTMRRHTINAKDDLLELEQMKRTIEERLKVTLPDDIGIALSDGVVLCHFINQIRPRSVQSIHVPSQAVPKLSLAKCRKNIENFIEASRRIGVPEVDLCSVQDIIEEKHTVRLARHINLLVEPNAFEQTKV